MADDHIKVESLLLSFSQSLSSCLEWHSRDHVGCTGTYPSIHLSWRWQRTAGIPTHLLYSVDQIQQNVFASGLFEPAFPPVAEDGPFTCLEGYHVCC